MRPGVAVTLILSLFWAGCAHKKRARVVPPPAAPAAVIGSTEEGIASWYGHPYHGRPAADGEIYDMEKMTAAHRTLPFDTWVRVDDLDSHKSCVVRINDRGPFVDGRILDVSHAAARSLGMIGPGTARVRLTVVESPANAEPARFAVQVGAFRDRDNAERLRREMEEKYGTARLVLRDGNPALWRVLVGNTGSEADAGALAAKIRQDGARKSPAFVVRLDARS